MAAPEIPDKFYFKIGEVSRILGVKPYVLRFWETEFRINPSKNKSQHRVYKRQEVETLQEIKRLDLAGDIATVFFREDGSFDGIPLNERASGPGLELFRKKHGICVVSGLAKVRGLAAALKGRLISELIVDEPTARSLVEGYILPSVIG